MRIHELLKLDINEMSMGGKLLPAKNVVGENVFGPDTSYVGKRLYHGTKNLKKIQASGALKPKPDISGTQEFWNGVTDFRPPVGIFCSTEPESWGGDSIVSFIVTKDDVVYHAYSKNGWPLIANPILLHRLRLEVKTLYETDFNQFDMELEQRLLKLRDEAIAEIKPTNTQLAGYCAEISILVWIKLGKPRELYPYSVMFGGGEEHVILYNKKNDWAFDPTSDQFDNSQLYFNFDPHETYRDFERLNSYAIAATLEDIEKSKSK